MMFHTIYFLICFVTFSRHQHNIFWFGKFNCHFYGFSSVRNRSVFAEILRLNTCFYFFDNLRWLFSSWIVRCDDCQSRFFGSDVAHFRTFGFVSVSTTTENTNQSFVFGSDFVDAVQHVFQCIWRVRIIDHEENSAVRFYRFESSIHSFQC